MQKTPEREQGVPLRGIPFPHRGWWLKVQAPVLEPGDPALSLTGYVTLVRHFPSLESQFHGL